MNISKRIHLHVLFGFLLVVVLFTACASPSPTPPIHLTIGVINLSPQLEPVLDGFKQGLTALGYTQVNYIYDGPSPDLPSLDGIAQNLVAQQPDLIVSISTPASQAAYRATLDTPIPVIFGPVTDPIRAGLLTDLVHPARNLTGVRLGLESEAQRMQWLLKIVPEANRIFVPYNSNDSSSQSSVEAAQAAAENFGVELVLVEARDADEITRAIETIPEDVQAIFLPQDSLVAARIDDFAIAAIARKLPLCTPTDGQVQRGALLSYSFKLLNLGEQMARLADQIFRQVSPSNIPVETAEFFLSVNLQTANAIEVLIPEEILRAADNIVR